MSWCAGADLLVVGGGAAGLTAALRARESGLRVLVVTKDVAPVGNTRGAQGGIAAVLPEQCDPGDSTQRHLGDTVDAGGGLCSRRVVREVLRDGQRAVRWLQAQGARFDMEADGSLARTREGGHSTSRVVHSGGDATGMEVQRALSTAVSTAGIPVLERHCVVEILRGESGAVSGVLALDASGRPGVVHAPAVLLATGGLGQLYAATTNPAVATADGVALALRAGATVADVEFVQFHPTVLAVPGSCGAQRPLVTEAVRGEGAVLVDGGGRRVMAGEHPLGDLAARDVVAAAVARRPAGSVYLDATTLGSRFAGRFPTVFEECRAAGVDPSREPIPVMTAAHYSCGGIESTVSGRTVVPGLYAAGEVARTGLHGANRLASNSLLEGLVTGTNAAEAVARDLRCGLLGRTAIEQPPISAVAVADRALVQQTMSASAGAERSEEGLRSAKSTLDRSAVVRPLRTRGEMEDASLTLTAQALLTAARVRTESRGCHRRSDWPKGNDARWRHSIVLRLDVSGWLIHAESESLANAA